MGNEISDNEVGVFAVTRCAGRSVFRRNNIRRNLIPIKLGWDQAAGLPFPENYWGDMDAQTLLERVVDARERPEGPPVFLAPLLPEPVPVPWPIRLPPASAKGPLRTRR